MNRKNTKSELIEVFSNLAVIVVIISAVIVG